LFVILLTTFGTVANTVGVFVPELTRQFGWGRGQVSLLTSTISLAAAASAFPVGWLLDRIEAKFVMVGGTVAAVAGYVLASRAEDFTHLLVAHILLGVCVIASGTGTAALVIANWFEAGQGTALAITVSGTSVGGLLSNLLVSRVIARWGWRTFNYPQAAPW
jgi:MFS family permease